MLRAQQASAVSAAVVGALAAGPVFAAPLTGSLIGPEEGEGVNATGQWADRDFTVSWSIDDNLDGETWNYNYTFSGNNEGTVAPPDISYFILQLTEGAPASDFTNFSISHGTLTGPEVRTFEPTDPGGASPNLPGSIYGAKLEVEVNEEDGAFTVSFDANRLPMWGDFYAKGASEENLSEAWNADFGAEVFNLHDYTASAALAMDGQTELAKILVPNTAVPEPGTLALLGLGGALMLCGRRPTRAMATRTR